ncbi:dihydroxyacetone kinase subunit DhaL [Neobacillus sp. DY30]|uniref:dihydroxyacetone kinase subunit DhaL n=1 Tax=Neobacillus sp. DY30 TaxID=3047871 RepID=UPI0024C0BF08|nr:dihydroxyacetone kinase subunit DhaL [Neobacillus sp. DY30]WHY00386.1 dihydroxyacetone kinase subunit DhaL [Neobacillus sp. DY30]
MIYVEDVKDIFKEIRVLIDDHKDFLCQLDGSLGDGDIGITLSKGFAAIDTTSLEYGEKDIGTLLLSYGMVMGEKAPSTMGTLLASAFLKTGKQFKGQEHLTLNDLVTFLETMIQGIKDRGKAELGDKTVLDSLIPPWQTLKTSSENKESYQQAFEKAYKSADEGMKNTINMKSRKGRAARYLDDSIGKQDPGATVGALFIKGILNYVTKNQTKLETANTKG